MKTILITGASRGIGRAIAAELHGRGHHVVATARVGADLTDVPAAVRLELDVTDPASVLRAARRAGDVDVLVNNAGIALRGPVEHVRPEAVSAMVEVNVIGALRMIQAVLPGMRRRGGGTVVQVSSVAGRVGFPLMGAYVATKFALEGISESLALEVAADGVGVLVVQPGHVTSGGYERSELHIRDDAGYERIAGLLARRPAASASPAEVAVAIARAVEREAVGLRRVPVGDAAAGLLAARASMDDERFTAALLDGLGLTEAS